MLKGCSVKPVVYAERLQCMLKGCMLKGKPASEMLTSTRVLAYYYKRTRTAGARFISVCAQRQACGKGSPQLLAEESRRFFRHSGRHAYRLLLLNLCAAE